MSRPVPLKLAILWHMHQPDYREPFSNRLALPWVRLHAIKDYLDMPLLATRHEGVRTTFNLVPSLIDQIQAYLDGDTDPHLELTEIPADQLSSDQKRAMLKDFFSTQEEGMIKPYPRYHALFLKSRNGGQDEVAPSLFTTDEFRDLQVWWNLTWVDPMFRDEEPVKRLFEKGAYFTEEEKHALLDWQRSLMSRIIPTYRRLLESDQIDISFTPYYHPILPLLCDTDIAREAIPNIELPDKRFQHPEDARAQIRMACAKYEELFGRPMRGMWPSEGSVSEEVASLCAEEGLKWIATDEEVLFHSLNRSGLDPATHPLQSVYEFQQTPGMKLFFRDHALSDRIGFVYSGWDTERAVDDFIGSLKKIRHSLAGRLEESVVSVILDGENAWEYFPDDAHEFLDAMYQRLGSDDEIETVTMSDAAAAVPARPLKRLFAGSWINHNFRIWIGHSQDNAAWDLLSETRNVLVQFEKDNPAYPEDKIRAAWKQIYIAEGSDWNWWYGDEHRSDYSDQFDRIYRLHLIAVYQILGLEIPVSYLSPIREASPSTQFTLPDSLISPVIDGRLTHFYEWAGAGRFDCRSGGGAMHRVDRIVSQIRVGFDYEAIYIRLDFDNVKNINFNESVRLRLAFYTPDLKVVEIPCGSAGKAVAEEGPYRYCLKDVLEVAVQRNYLWPGGFGSIGLLVSVHDGAETIETWPDQEPLEIEVPEKNKEMFWPS